LKLVIFGHTGFIGKNYLRFTEFRNFQLVDRILLNDFNKIHFNSDAFAVLNFIGKAHDLKKNNTPDEYYYVNTYLTEKIFDHFLLSNAKVFITISSVKAAADATDQILTEEFIPKPITDYGKSKLLAEQYILSKDIPVGKRVYILRPCMIHGPGNKGNLNLLYNIVSRGFPWPLGAFENKRSFCSIDNFCFIINELIENDQINSGVYNIADDEAVSTIELIRLIAESNGKKPFILNIPKFLIKILSKLGDIFKLPLNSERISKLTETYVVSNQKIKNAINKPFPVSAKVALLNTFNSFNNIN
jgi:nucleoside-diphosphate-sugar epimerase